MLPTLYDQARLRRILFIITLLFVAIGLLVFSGIVRAAGYEVRSLGDVSDANPGDLVCRTVAGECTLRAAIEEANATAGLDVITFAPTFTFPITIPVSPTLVIIDGVTINGPGAGLLTLVGGGQDRIFSIDSPNSPVNLLNLTVTNGQSNEDGGAILFGRSGCCSSKETLNLTTVVIRGNSAQNGGAISMLGGGFYSTVNLTLNLTDVMLAENLARSSGGALYASGDPSIITILASNFTTNTATGNGGAINVNNSSTEVNASTFSNNRAGSNASAILADNRIPALAETPTAFPPTPVSDGGGIYNQGSTLNLVNSTLSGNSATGNGGAIANVGGTPPSPVSIDSSTIVNNSATGGGGIYQQGSFSPSSVTMQMTNTIIADNLGVSASPDDCRNVGFSVSPPGPFTSFGYNLTITGTSTGCFFTSVGDQRIQPSQFPLVLNPILANNGGSTGNHALLPGSLAIDRGGNCPPPTTDQRGAPRPLGAACDIGAYEAAQAALVVTKTVGIVPSVCAATSFRAVEGGTNLYYCVTVKNTGNITVANHTIRDAALGINAPLSLPLAPGAVAVLTNANIPALGPIRAGVSLTNTVFVTATDSFPGIGSVTAVGAATARTVVTPVFFLSLPTALASQPVGVERSVTATVTDHLDRLTSGVAVTFIVTGANSARGTAITGPDGRATFIYTGTTNTDSSDIVTASSETVAGAAIASGAWRPISVKMKGSGVGDNAQVVRTITATVMTDDNQQRIGGLAVGFAVSGGTIVPPRIIRERTNLQGQTVFTYTSIAPPVNMIQASAIQATDVISVWVDLNRNAGFITGEPFDLEMVVTAITLASFTAQTTGDTVHLAWATAVEIDNAGFNLLRASRAEGPYVQINDQLIGAQGNGTGASYSFVDTPPGAGPFYYKLEDIDYNGVRTLHGPIEVWPGLGNGGARHIYLPFVQR